LGPISGLPISVFAAEVGPSNVRDCKTETDAFTCIFRVTANVISLQASTGDPASQQTDFGQSNWDRFSFPQ